jgi:heterodisulfide reductase subunit A
MFMTTTLVLICECGPLLGESIDLGRLAEEARRLPGVGRVERYSTLCSEEGKGFMETLLADGSFDRVVLAGCSPHQHEATFQAVLRDCGMNPFLLTMANIREQCGWVSEDRTAATEKALHLISGAVARCRLQQPLEVEQIEANLDVAVLGSGVAGLQAALLAARAGRNVVVVEKSPCIGGRAAMLSEVFPGGLCASCLLEPLMDEVLHHDRIEMLTCSGIEEVLGCQGNFTMRIRRKARHVDEKGCYGCGTCHEACPVVVPDPVGQGTRKAVYIPYPGALPHVSVVDESACLRFRGADCDACARACPFGNIDLSAGDEVLERKAGAIILATGAVWTGGPHFPSTYPNILTLPAFERLFHPDGPTGGELRLKEGAPIRSVVLVADPAPSHLFSEILAHLVGEIRKKAADVRIDLVCRAGPRSEFPNADASVNWIPLNTGARLSVTGDDIGPVRILIESNGGPAVRTTGDIAVWVGGLAGDPALQQVARGLRLELDSDGFVQNADSLASFSTRAQGIFVAGCAQGPKGIRESATQGAAAAGATLSLLSPGKLITLEPCAAHVQEEACAGCGMCAGACPYQAILHPDDNGQKARVLETLCRGCGTCAALCPSGAISTPHFTDAQILAEIGGLLQCSATPSCD